MIDTPAPTYGQTHKWVRPVVDFGALAIFAATYIITHDIVRATWAIVAGSVLALAVGLIFEKRIALMPLLVGLFGLVFGGLTLVFHDTKFIKMEGSFLYAAMGAGLLIGVAMRKNPLKSLLGSELHMPDAIWRTLAIRYGLFFLVLAVINEVVRQTQSNDTWTSFKIGKMILVFAFSFSQAPLMMRGMKEAEAADQTGDTPPPVSES